MTLEQGAEPGTARCPACGEPLFVWVEAAGYGPLQDQVIDRCENCGLAVAREAAPSPDEATDALLSGREQRGDRIAVRVDNAASLQAWLGAENWAALRPGGARIKPTPRAASLLLARRGLEVRRVRHLLRPGMASMWQTLLNLLTFHRDFASEAVSRRLRPGTGRGRAAFWIDAVVTVLAAIPTAFVAVLLEGGAVLARRGGVIEVQAERLPATG
ncbi:MAG TPA: hypothetical protein VGJ61_07415 [Solirubrobacterales bacterium]